MSFLANEASGLPSRVSQAIRVPQQKTAGQDPNDPRAFASLMDRHRDPAPEPKAGPTYEPKSARSADKPSPRDNDQETVSASRDVSASECSEAATNLENAEAEGELKASAPDKDQAAADTPKTDSEGADADPSAAPTLLLATVAVADPNATALPVVAEPAAPIAGENGDEIEGSAKPVGAETAPALPAADLNAAQTQTANGKSGRLGTDDPVKGAQLQAAQPKAAQSTEPTAAKDDAEASQDPQGNQAAHHLQKAAKPEGGQHADGAPRELQGEQPETVTGDPTNSQVAKPAGDVTPHAANPVATHLVAGTPAAHTQTTAGNVTQPIPINAIAVEIAGQARAGNSRFEIRLDPPELGRIDVRLDVDRDGNVTSRLVIERADTYDLLRRDQSTLERALQQAGLKTSDNSLEFQLRDQGFARQQPEQEPSARGTTALIGDAETTLTEAATGYARLLQGSRGIDIRV